MSPPSACRFEPNRGIVDFHFPVPPIVSKGWGTKGSPSRRSCHRFFVSYPSVYHPRNVRATALYQLLETYYEQVKDLWEVIVLPEDVRKKVRRKVAESFQQVGTMEWAGVIRTPDREEPDFRS